MALEERIRVYQETGKGLSFANQCKVLIDAVRIYCNGFAETLEYCMGWMQSPYKTIIT